MIQNDLIQLLAILSDKTCSAAVLQIQESKSYLGRDDYQFTLGYGRKIGYGSQKTRYFDNPLADN